MAKLEVEVFELHGQLENELRFDMALINGAGRGRPKSGPFVGYVRCLLGTGVIAPSPSPSFPAYASPTTSTCPSPSNCASHLVGSSARACREQMLVSAAFYMAPKKFEQFRDQVPHVSWFKTQRKGLQPCSSFCFLSSLTFSCLVLSPTKV